MKERKIVLQSAKDAKEFVSIAASCDFDIDLYDNSVVLDAKSLIGVLSLDLRHSLTVKYDGMNEELEAFLTEHDAACAKVA